MEHVVDDKGELDDDYDRDNPWGTMSGRRNYGESAYYSGTQGLSPGEYRKDGFDFYKKGYGFYARHPD